MRFIELSFKYSCYASADARVRSTPRASSRRWKICNFSRLRATRSFRKEFHFIGRRVCVFVFVCLPFLHTHTHTHSALNRARSVHRDIFHTRPCAHHQHVATARARAANTRRFGGYARSLACAAVLSVTLAPVLLTPHHTSHTIPHGIGPAEPSTHSHGVRQQRDVRRDKCSFVWRDATKMHTFNARDLRSLTRPNDSRLCAAREFGNANSHARKYLPGHAPGTEIIAISQL